MNRARILSRLLVLALATTAHEAHAWLSFCNRTPNTVWVAYAFRRQCGFWTCGETGCGSSYRVRGWYAIAPQGCATVNGGDQTYYTSYFYAEDDFGHVWSGLDPKDRHCTPWTVFDYCKYENVCNTQSRMLYYRYVENISYENFTVNLIL